MCRPRNPEYYGWCDNLPVEDVKPSKEPAPVLGEGADKRIDEAVKDYSYKKCDEYVRPLLECTKEYGFFALFNCQKQKNAMLECMQQYWTEEIRDVYRRSYAQRFPKAVKSWKIPGYDIEE